jgi:hypothetical protein
MKRERSLAQVLGRFDTILRALTEEELSSRKNGNPMDLGIK